MEESNPLCCEVLTGSSRRLQPREFIESRKEEEAMAADPEGREREGRVQQRQDRDGADTSIVRRRVRLGLRFRFGLEFELVVTLGVGGS
jgi:hypothetical protein